MKKLLAKYRELIVYLITGVLTTAVNWVSYAVGVSFFRWSIILSNVIAWIVAVAFAYVTNKIWVFQSYSWKFKFVLRELALFVSARIVTGLLEVVGVPILVGLGLDQSIMGVKGMLSKITVSVAVLILNYAFSKLIIFRKKG